jgi:hypothetical protein
MKQIKLYSRKYPNIFTLVDDEDYNFLNKYHWNVLFCKTGGPSAHAKIKEKWIYMHRLIMNTPPELECDHKDHNTLNNQKYNLRNCTRSQNQMNAKNRYGSSKYKGVSWCSRKKSWQVRIRIKGQRQFLGRFENEEEAAKVYRKAAKELHGEFYYEN